MNTDTLGKRMAESTTPVFQFDGRWFIAMGQPGFNCKANNRDGFAKAKQAFDTIDRFSVKRCHFGECGQANCTGCGVPVKG